MKPIYFPFTCISDSVAQALTACFGHFTAYQPLVGKLPQEMQPWVAMGNLEIRVPRTGDEAESEKTIKDFLNWAELHAKGSNLKHLKGWMDTLPLFSLPSTSQLMADIKKRANQKPASKALKPVAAARIFLYFAQEFDRQNHELARELNRYRQKEAALIRELKTENDPLAAEFRKADAKLAADATGFMTADRLQAWTRIMLADIDLSGIFVTHVAEVLQDLLDKTPPAVKLCNFESIPIGPMMSPTVDSWRQRLLSDLSDIVLNEWSPHTGLTVGRPVLEGSASTLSLTLYLVPHQTPRDFFSRIIRIEPPGGEARRAADPIKNTLIGLIEVE